MEQLALTNIKNLQRQSTLWSMTNKALKIPLIHPRKSINTAIVYNDLCIIMYFKQYDISPYYTHNIHARTCISTQIRTAVTLSSLLSSLATSPTSQPPCFLSVSIFVQHRNSSGYHFWRFGVLDKDNYITQVPSFSFHPLHFILSQQLLLVQL